MKVRKHASLLLAGVVLTLGISAHLSCADTEQTTPWAGGDPNGGNGGSHGVAGGGGSIGTGASIGNCPADSKNKCGTCDPQCHEGGAGNSPFPIDPNGDPNVKDATGVKLDPNGDLTLDGNKAGFNFMWISNTYDVAGKDACATENPGNPALCRGSVSKIDTVAMKEVARYYSTTCSAKSGPTGCVDVNGQSIDMNHNHTPSRTAVDYNFDAWVANRNLHGGQPSATKFANSPADCIDRNGNGTIDTSEDQNGDGTINVDCNGDGAPDSLATVCTGAMTGKQPEFLGDDDECILFTTNFAEPGDVGRSMCLDANRVKLAASDAWVGTYYREINGKPSNNFYAIDGTTGKIKATVAMPHGHNTYGCAIDDKHILWATDIGNGDQWPGSLAFFSTLPPNPVGPLMRGPTADGHWQDAKGEYHHYGIAINMDQHVWLGGWTSSWVLRYKPVRTSFDTLSQGTWTRIDVPAGFVTRGIAADMRGKIWVSVQDGGYLLRLDQSLPDGVHDMTQMTDYWKLKANIVIGAGVDMSGNIWGVGNGNKTASRLDVDANGNVLLPATGEQNNVTIGESPYTYSDFTGYALIKFLLAQGRYVYQYAGCPNGAKAVWKDVSWNATTPPNTEVILRVRTGDSDATFGPWSQQFNASPAIFVTGAAANVAPNPSVFIQV